EPDAVWARGHVPAWAGGGRACVTPSPVPAAPRRISTARRGRHSAVTSQHGHGGSRPCNESALGWGSRGRALYGSSESDIRRSYCPTTGSSVVPRSPVGQRSLSEREPMHNRRSFFRGASLAPSAAALGGSLAACSRTSTGGEGGEDGGSDLLSQLQDAGKIVVGFAGEAPYSFEDGGELMGATVAMHREIFGSLGIDEVEGKLTDWNSLIPGLNSRQFDAVSAGMSILPERCAVAAFSEPEFQYTTALMVPEGNPEGLENMDSFVDSGLTVATMSGAIESTYATDLGLDSIEVGGPQDGVD